MYEDTGKAVYDDIEQDLAAAGESEGDIYALFEELGEPVEEVPEDVVSRKTGIHVSVDGSIKADKKTITAVGSSLEQYFKEIGRYDLLTPEEEKALAARVEAGDEEAKRQMCECNLRLVVSIARHYMDGGVPFQDLIQEGNIGLLSAVEKYDHHKGYKFSTYATWWIRQKLGLAVASQSRVIRLPVHASAMVSKISNATRMLEQKLGREPTDSEVAEVLSRSEQFVRDIRLADQAPMSTTQTIRNSDGEATIESFIADTAPNQMDIVEELMLHKDLVRFMNELLSPREKRIVRARYGFDNGETMTLEEVGKIEGISRERVRQIEARALDKIRKRLVL